MEIEIGSEVTYYVDEDTEFGGVVIEGPNNIDEYLVRFDNGKIEWILDNDLEIN